MQSGKIKFYNTAKAYGFIIPDNGGDEVFFHKTGLNVDTVKEHDRVVFETKQGKKGQEACDIELE